jgi:hypothetical protein
MLPVVGVEGERRAVARAAAPIAREERLFARDLDVALEALAELAEPADRYWSTRSELAWN